MKKNPFLSNHEADKEKKPEEIKNKSIAEMSNNNFNKTKQYVLEAEKDTPNNNIQNLNNYSNSMKIQRKGNIKLGNSNIKLNFDYKKQSKDNTPITLMHINRK